MSNAHPTGRRHRAPASLAALLLTATATATAQPLFGEPERAGWPSFSGSTHSIAVGDVDGNGTTDVLLTTSIYLGSPIAVSRRLLLNRGPADFVDASATHLPSTSDLRTSLALGDLDGDQDLDLLTGSRLWLNDGSGRFSDRTSGRLPTDLGSPAALALGDLDGDGDLDVVAVGFDGFKILLNDGSARFRTAAAPSLPTQLDGIPSATLLLDVDADGDLDLLAGLSNLNTSTEPRGRLWLNSGAASFTDGSARLLPDMPVIRAIAVGDLDGDSDPDLVVSAARSLSQGDPVLWNDGTGNFRSIPAGNLPNPGDQPVALALADMDGDGDLDLLAGSDGRGLPARLFRNDGSGGFAAGELLEPRGGDGATRALVVADLDADGDRDVVLASFARVWRQGGRNRLLLNDGGGRFLSADADPLPTNAAVSTRGAFGDLDGDGFPDLYESRTDPAFDVADAPDRLLRNDGTGTFHDESPQRLPADYADTDLVRLVDLDRDGALDAVVAHETALDVVLHNDGTGHFPRSGRVALAGSDASTSTALATGDFDLDGDPDVLATTLWGPNRLYRNDGRRSYVDVSGTALPSWASNSVDVDVADLDGDGDLDAALANVPRTGQPATVHELLWNDGQGRFRSAPATAPAAQTGGARAVRCVDLDGDSHPDLLYAGDDPPLWLFHNDGRGSFTDQTSQRLPPRSGSAGTLLVHDLDLDGDPDIVFGFRPTNRSPEVLQVVLNDGRGVFSPLPGALEGTLLTGRCRGLAIDDIDLDGDADLLVFTDDANRLYLNWHSQLEVPARTRPGGTLLLRGRHRDVTLATPDLMLPLVAPLPARTPVQGLGVAGIDLALAIPLPPLWIAPETGIGTLAVPVPPLPSLVDRTLWTQAVLAPARGPARLTNTVAVPVFR